ncbi:c-type cytochrome [Yoonia sp. R2-816]|uniref:c-type cytochrome n=1 Tax=Yoonia sp. R2-816 TaxID=3342638 RepID=UPI00372CC062
MIAGLGVGWFITRPVPLPAAAIDGLAGDPVNGETIFAAAGCGSCHSAPEGDPLILAGGRTFPSDFGSFIAPNISPDPVHGIGAWSDLDLASAITRGVSPGGAHYYPAFPYSAYNKAELADIVDLIAYLRTLPPSTEPSQTHDVGFPFNIRATLGGWKLLFLSDDWALSDTTTPEISRGRYLVEALGHCTECHTERNALGGLKRNRWLAGAPNPSGEGRIPNITPVGLDWSEGEIAEYLKSGFTPDFDTAGGEMTAVIRNTSQLTDADRAAIAAYLKAIPGVGE